MIPVDPSTPAPLWVQDPVQPHRWRLQAGPYFRLDTAMDRPNAWVRFWQWLLLGWTWEPLPDILDLVRERMATLADEQLPAPRAEAGLPEDFV